MTRTELRGRKRELTGWLTAAFDGDHDLTPAGQAHDTLPRRLHDDLERLAGDHWAAPSSSAEVNQPQKFPVEYRQ